MSGSDQASGLRELPADAARSLADAYLLQDEEAATARQLEAVAKWYFCPKDTLVFDRADASRDIYFVVEGKVRATDKTDSGLEIAFDDLAAGQVVGELSAIDGEARSAELYALEDSVLAVVPREAFVDFVEQHPEVAFRLMRHLVHAIRTLNERVVGLSSTSVLQRVYEQILKIAEPDPFNPRRLVIETMPRHKDIAIWAGTTPEVVARAVGRLIEANVARRLRKSLHILDPKRLRELVEAT